MRQKSGQKLEIRERRIFSEELKKKAVRDLVGKRTTIRALVNEHQVSHQAVYRWLYKYSPHHGQKSTLVVQMNSEETKNQDLRARVAELERVVGQKQLEIDFLNKLLEIGSSELGFDLKKNFSTPPSNGTAGTSKNTAIK
jgi:transposase-like protein